MSTARIFRGLLSVCLTAALVFSWTIPALANEDGTVSADPVETEATVPPETTTETQIPETQPEETQRPETTLPPAETLPEETRPAETAPAQTLPPETEATIPETLPQETVPQILTVAEAKAMVLGEEDLLVQGTVVYSDYGLTVLQDTTGGIRLTCAQDNTPAPGQVIQVTATRTTDGLLVFDWEHIRTTSLPAMETTLDAAPEYTRIVVRGASYNAGTLIQGNTTVSMTPAKPDGISDGDMVTVWGVMAEGWFYVDSILREETEPAQTEPALTITATPADGILLPGEMIGLHCDAEGVQIRYALSYDGITYGEDLLYSGGIPVDADADCVYVRAYALGEDGSDGTVAEFLFERPGETEQEVPQEENGWNLYFGQLHAHTAASNGFASAEDAFAYAAGTLGLDFFAVTDQSQTFDNAELGAISDDREAISAEWEAGKKAAAKYTNDDFVGIFGYEMAWQEGKILGHMNTFNTPGWQSRNQAAFSTLESYYEALTTVPGSISQFNHPGAFHGYFENFAHYSPQYDAVIHLLEVGTAEGYQYYTRALDQGWHVAPTNNQSGRTVALAKKLTEAGLYDAMRNHRVYATEDNDLEILYYLNGSIMGSVLNTSAQTVTVTLHDPTDSAIGTVEVVADGGAAIALRQVETASETLTIPVSGSYTYYYLRITQPDGDIAVTAPVWVDPYTDLGVESFTADSLIPQQGQETTLSLTLYNRESVDFRLETLEFSMEGQVIHRAENPGTVAGHGTFSYRFPFCYNGLGEVEIRVCATGTAGGTPQTCEGALTLHYQTQPLQAQSAISYVRSGIRGQAYTIKGYVTAGTSNASTTFPGMIYVQDDTGGIGVVSFTDTGIQIGTPIQATGILAEQDGNPVLELLSYEVLNESDYRYVPETLDNRSAMDLSARGGQLLQVQGQVVSLTRTADGLGISRFTLRDSQGNLATVRIDDGILSGSYGVNRLASQVRAGSTVRAMGILHREADGTAVLRVRNCDEVVYVQPVADPTNPKTGRLLTDPASGISLGLLLSVLGISLVGLLALRQLGKKQR